MRYTLRLKGGPGSGHFGHKGIPGHRGGSLPRGESKSSYGDSRKRVLSSGKLLDEASEAWFEYYDAAAIKAISKGEKISVGDDYGDGSSEFTAEDISRFTKYAKVLQDAASTTNSGYDVLWRGTVLEESVLPQYAVGKVITLDGLTASSPNPKIAEIYNDDPYDLGQEVMFKIINKNGIIGYERDEGSEVILPRGSKYTVQSNKKVRVS